MLIEFTKTRVEYLLISGLITTILGVAGFGQPDTKSVEELQRLNKQVVTEYQAFKFDDALKTANESLKLGISLFGDNSLEAALSYEYLGEIYLVKQKSGLAVTNFQTAWNIHKKYSFKNITRAGRVLTQLAPAMIADKKEAELREILLAITKAADSGESSASKLLPFALYGLTKLYTHTRQFEMADDVFLKLYSLFTKLTDQNIKDFQYLSDERARYDSANFSLKDSIERGKKFRSALKTQAGDDLIFGGVFYEARKSEVTPGKALNLAKPEYPPAARAVRAGGKVTVKTLIDENGNVVEATALNGHPLLRSSAVEAAKRSKFSPTFVADKAVRVSGILTFAFVP